MFVELLSLLRSILSMLRSIRTEQIKQGEEQRRQAGEQQRQSDILVLILEAVTLPAAEVLNIIGEVEGVPQGDGKMRMFESQQGSLTLSATTKSGKPAKVDGVPVWAVQPGMESAVSLVVAEDGMSAVVKGQPFAAEDANVKSLSILVTADADLGEGVKPLQASASIEVVRDEAVVLALSEGEVSDQ